MAVCWDKYAAIHLSKEIHLPPMPAHVLWTLVLLADHRSHAWTGTLGELALDVITSRSTVSRAMKDLADRGLIEYAEPFTRNKPGIVVINVYRLIHRTTRRPVVAKPLTSRCHVVVQICTLKVVMTSTFAIRLGIRARLGKRRTRASHSLEE